MSNLGWYQTIVQWSKKVGGPRKLLFIVFSLGSFFPWLVVIIWKWVKSRASKNDGIETPTIIYTVEKDATSSDALSLKKGSQFKVWGRDKDALIIEVLNDQHNPYCVSAKWLSSVSNLS
jgi:hypothetical protein